MSDVIHIALPLWMGISFLVLALVAVLFRDLKEDETIVYPSNLYTLKSLKHQRID